MAAESPDPADQGGADIPPKKPLSCTWREWISNTPDSSDPIALEFDVAIVGSGYGGAVAALRLAEKGYRVLVFERGSEYLPGDFPNQFSQVPKHLRINLPSHPLPGVRASGLIEITIGQGIVAVTGNGLGGGSLVNAGVVMQPDEDVFAQDAWPASIRHNTQANATTIPLWEAFAKAKAALGAVPFKPSIEPLKSQALKQAANRSGAGKAVDVDLTIRSKFCTQCGDCASGCNVPEAKGDLTSTYLREAVYKGCVQIVTQAEVYRFAPALESNASDNPTWDIWIFSTEAQHQKTSREEAGAFHDLANDRASTLRVLRAPRLILSAGTLGSTQLLQRSQALTGEALAFSPALGTRLSGNGDALSVLVQGSERVNAVGHGSLPPETVFSPNDPNDHQHVVGPTITVAIDARSKTQPLTERVVLQDGAIPGTVSRVFEELIATTMTLQQMDRWAFFDPLNKGHARNTDQPIKLDTLAASKEAAARSQVWLTMGHDGSPGRIVWLPGTDGSAMVMPNPGELKTYQAQQALFDRLQGNAIHIHSPLWRQLPGGITRMMSGAAPKPIITSVHPLGGCPMSDSPASGVVNELGQVWIHQPSHPSRSWASPSDPHRYPESPTTYPGLFVLDGSIVPTSLGCNPLLTITALAERAMSAWPSKLPVRLHQPHKVSALRPLCTPRLEPLKWSVVLREELIAKRSEFTGYWAGDEPGIETVSLQVAFCSTDFESDLKVHNHPLPIGDVRLTVKSAHGDIAYCHAASLSQHTFHFLPAPPGHQQAWWPTLWTALELAPLLWGLFTVLAIFVDKAMRSMLSNASGPHTSNLLFAAIAIALASLVLPTQRTLFTWLVLRGHDDIRDWFRKHPLEPSQPLWAKLRSLLKQLVHSREKRVMHYDLTLQRDGATITDFPKHIRLQAQKTVVYRASVRDVLVWMVNRCRSAPPAGRMPLRPTYWERIMDADATVRSSDGLWSFQPTLFKGRLRMGLDNLFKSNTAQLGPEGDSTTGLLMLAGYGLLALRFGVKTHVFDFRLPSYSQLPIRDASDQRDTELVTASGTAVKPFRHRLTVPRGWSSGDGGAESLDPLQLSLWQYKRDDLTISTEDGNVWPAVVRAKVVLLLHAFGQSGLTFTYANQENPSSLARHLHEEGYEVWVLDSRMSTRSGYAEHPSNVDMMGEHDVPLAVDHVLNDVKSRLPKSCSLSQTQIALVAQCIGSASAWMAALSGRLDQGGISKLYALVSSQVHPVMRGSRLSQAKTSLPTLLRHAADVVPFAVRGPQDNGALQLLDRLFSSLPVPETERALSGNEDAVATCRRIRFIEAPLFLHQNMGQQTIADMPKLFGNANLRLFEHARRFISQKRLVDEDGLNRYVTEENARRHVRFPVLLLHGRKNELFDAESAHATRAWLKSVGAWQPKSQCRTLTGYGHLDVWLGQRAAQEVFPCVSKFLNSAYGSSRVQASLEVNRWRLMEPVHGPVLGWIRLESGVTVVRSSLILDEGFDGAHNPESLRVVVRETSIHATQRPDFRQLHYVVMRPDFKNPDGAGTPAYLSIQLDILVSSALTSFDCEVLVFRATQSVSGLSSDALRDDNQLNAARDVLGSDFSTRSRLRVSDQTLASIRPSNEVTIWASCCRYPGLSIDSERIDHMLETQLTQGPLPAMALLLGDQIYADATAGLVDPVSPIERYFERHLTAFNAPTMRRLMRCVPTLMTPDDHEWLDNYPSAAPLLKWSWPDWKNTSIFWKRQHAMHKWARRSVRVFQKMHGPSKVLSPLSDDLPATETGPVGPLRIFLLDSRYSRKRSSPDIVSDETLLELANWLAQAKRDKLLPVVACGSVVLPGLHDNADPAYPGAPDSWQYAPKQRGQLLKTLVELEWPFILLSGDYHVSAALTVFKNGKPVGAAIVVPPMYAPLPYANSKPHHLNVQETLQIGNICLSMAVASGGEALSGSGLATISVEAKSSGGFTVTVTRELQTFGEEFAKADIGKPIKAVIQLP